MGSIPTPGIDLDGNPFYMSENQYAAVDQGTDFVLFLVCGVNDPANVRIFEIPSSRLRRVQPKREVNYYYDKGLLDQLLGS